MPVHKETNSFVEPGKLSTDLNNDFSIFAELMINFPSKFIEYFNKHELFFDFIFSLTQSEISIITYQPEHLKALFIELLNILKTKEGFPIPWYNYFRYEGQMESTYLYVNVNGTELNKIVEDKNYSSHSNYDINASFDKWNNFSESGGIFKQGNTLVYIKTEEGINYRSNLDYNAFPGEIFINNTQDNIRLRKEIKKVFLVLKTPYEHLSDTFNNLIAICNVCIERGYGLKSYVSC